MNAELTAHWNKLERRIAELERERQLQQATIEHDAAYIQAQEQRIADLEAELESVKKLWQREVRYRTEDIKANQRLRQALEQHHAHYGPCRYCNMPERAVTPGAGGGQP